MTSLIVLLVLVGFMLLGFIETRAWSNLDFVVNVLLFALLLFELGRELWVCWTGIIPVPSPYRLRLLQVEYTLLGVFLREVIYHVDQNSNFFR